MQFDNMAVAATIRQLRTERGLSQEVLSSFAQIARSHLSMIETGRMHPNFETLWRIAQALDMRPSELVAKIELLCRDD